MTEALEDLLMKSYLKGKFRAVVDDIDDPKKMRRIKCKVPAISEDGTIGWANPSDDNRDEWLPKKGDYVWIEFEGWDIDFPIWTGYLPAKDDISSKFKDKYNEKNRVQRDYNDNYVEWTDKGIKVTDKNSNKITTDDKGVNVEDKNGNKFIMDDKGIKLEDKNGNKFEMTSDGIKLTDCNDPNTIEMKSGKVQVNGENLEVEK